MAPDMSPPRVAVLTSTYNGARHLEAQLDSLRAQENVEVRVHVRDDGSTDDTLALLKRYAAGWPNLNPPMQGPNLGPAASFLELLRTAPDDADYYAFCDQDDVWLPGKLARAVERLGPSGREPALYCSNVTCVDDKLAVLGTPRENGDARLQHLLFENIAYGCTTVMNRVAREAIAARPPERGVVMHDWWCALVVAALGEVRYDPQPHILYRQHGANSIGADANRLIQSLRQGRQFLGNPGGFYQAHGQAEEFLRLYRSELEGQQLAGLESFVRSKRTLETRLKYALSGQIVRGRPIDALVARGLIAAGWY